MSNAASIDHVYAFAGDDVTSLEHGGFRVWKGRDHPGQGTANRLILFDESYVELIYLARRKEAEQSELRLDRRADWRTTGHCPFGVAVRGRLDPQDVPHFRDHHPSYGHGLILAIHDSHWTQPHLPLVFTIRDAHGELGEWRPGPAHWSEITSQDREHPRGSRAIRNILIEGPSVEWHLATRVSPLECKTASNYRMIVEVDGPNTADVEVGELLKIVSRDRGLGQ